MEQSATLNTETNNPLIGVPPQKRVWSWLIDVISLYLIHSAAGFVLVFIFIGEVDLSETETRLEWILLLFSVLYYTLSEGVFGASIGKVFLGLRVVDLEGNPCSVWAAFVRGIFRFIDSLFFGVVALINMKPPLQQRLGDKVAKTVVVKISEQFPSAHRPVWIFWIIQISYFCFAVLGLFFRYALLPLPATTASPPIATLTPKVSAIRLSYEVDTWDLISVEACKTAHTSPFDEPNTMLSTDKAGYIRLSVNCISKKPLLRAMEGYAERAGGEVLAGVYLADPITKQTYPAIQAGGDGLITCKTNFILFTPLTQDQIKSMRLYFLDMSEIKLPEPTYKTDCPY